MTKQIATYFIILLIFYCLIFIVFVDKESLKNTSNDIVALIYTALIMNIIILYIASRKPFVDEYIIDNNKNIDKFKTVILAMFDKNLTNEINTDLINILSQSCNIDSIDTALYLKEILRDLIKDKDIKKSQVKNKSNLTEKIKLLKKMIYDIEREKPFYNMPKDISNIFNDIYEEIIIKDKDSKVIEKLSSLASIIRSKQDDYDKILLKSQKWQYAAFIIGIISIILAVSALFFK